MLAYVLALLVGLGSFGLYMVAFFFPEVHRKNDFFWSGVGLFYALVLWVCADRITRGVLLGQIAGVGLIGWLGWQTLLLRRQVAPLDQQTPLPTSETINTTVTNLSSPDGRSQLARQISRTLAQLKESFQAAIATASQSPPSLGTTDETYVPPSLDEFGTAAEEARDRFAKAAIADSTAPQVSPLASSGSVTPETIAAQDDVSEVIETEATAIAPAQDTPPTISEAISSVPLEQSPQSTPRSTTQPKLSKKAPNVMQGAIKTVQSLTKGFSQKPSKPVYVRKQFRDQPSEPADKVVDATVISVVEGVSRAPDGSLVTEATIEITSTELAPDLLATALANTEATKTAAKDDANQLVGEIENIVVELLEDITAQEQNSEATAETQSAEVPSAASAIADADSSGESVTIDPLTTEVEKDGRSNGQ